MKTTMLNAICGVLSALAAFAAQAGMPKPELIADYNRDGKIDPADYERMAKGEAFTIWLNDDDDAKGAESDEGKGDTNVDLNDVPGGNGHKDCADGTVNGRCDLLDFFPVLVNVHEASDWKAMTWKLCSDSVNVVFTGLKANTAGSFHTQEFKALDGDTPLYRAEVTNLTEGVALPSGFLDEHGKGVFLIEGRKQGPQCLTLCGYDGDGVLAAEVTMNLDVENVESLYGWMNLRGSQSSTSQPLNFLTSQPDNRHFVLVHGYNTNHEEARGNAAEFYKKLYQSGSDAMFTAVEWCGDQSQVRFEPRGVNFSPNYFANVENAFLAARPFAEACGKLPGEKILVGHSLGNVLISSAIKDYGLDYTKYVMLNVEVAGKEFAAGGRFANLPRAINYYSSTDSFFAESELDVENCMHIDLVESLAQEAGFWTLNAKIKTSAKAVGLVNECITNLLERTEADVISSEQLEYAGVIETPAAGECQVATLENVKMESFIGESLEWPLYEGEEVHTNLWNHSAFREVAFYHTSAFYASLAAVGKPRVIIDTDLGSSMDDLFTIDLAARMHKAGKLDLMAVMMDRPDNSDEKGQGEFLKFADRYLASLGFCDLPLGKSMPLTNNQHVFNPYWTLIYSNNVTGTGLLLPTNRTPEQIEQLPGAVALYRRLLDGLPDGQKVVICSTGFLTNLRGLLESGTDYAGDGIPFTGPELIAAKVKELRIMGGCFDPDSAPDDTDGAEYNFAGDPAAAKKVVEEWPTPVIVSPWEVGLKLDYKSDDVLADFPPGTFDPVVRAAYTYWPDPGQDAMNRLWDVMTLFPLTEGETLVPLSEMGGISVDGNGKTTFTPDASSNRCYQVASNMDATAVLNRLREICRTGNLGPADTVVYGTIRTAEEGNPVAEAIAIKDGKYIYVGDEAGVAAFIEAGVTKIVDHRGKGMVMPGCTDGHSHYAMKFELDNMKSGVMLALEDDKTAVLQKLSVAAQTAKDAGKQSLYGFGWSVLALRVEDKLTLAELDEATHGVSTVIFDQAGHSAYCNSECLRRCGIIDGNGKVLIDKIDGGLLELDEQDYPTGYVNERVTGYLMRMGGIVYDEIVDDEVAEASIRATQELVLSTGYTTVLEGWSNMLHPSKLYEAAHRMDTNGMLKLVFPMTYEVEPWQTNMNEQIDYLASLNEKYRTAHVRPEYLKVFMDGVVETKTGAIAKPYKDGTTYTSFWSVDRLANITEACNAKGLTVHVHAMGDAAIRDVTDAYIQGGDGMRRNCLVHLRNVCNEDFKRFADNNIACTAGFTWHAASVGQDEFLSQFLGEEYVDHAYPMKSFFDAGIKVSSHSDFPANEPSPQDPFGIMQVAVTGMVPDPLEGEEPFDTNELITVEQAFQALTLNGAWQMGLENERGSIKVGKWADFVLADQDVFTCAAAAIGKTKVVSTWFEGEKVYQAAASVPVVPGEPIVCDTAEKASNVLKRAEFTPSAEVAERLGGEGSTALQTYCNMFKLDVMPTSDGKWAVEAYLKPVDWTNVVESAQAATLQFPLADIAAWRTGDDPISVHLTNCVPGFFYSLYDGAAVTNLKADIRKENCNVLCGAEKTAVLPEVTKPIGGQNSGFFTIGVLEAPSVIPGSTATSTNWPAALGF